MKIFFFLFVFTIFSREFADGLVVILNMLLTIVLSSISCKRYDVRKRRERKWLRRMGKYPHLQSMKYGIKLDLFLCHPVDTPDRNNGHFHRKMWHCSGLFRAMRSLALFFYSFPLYSRSPLTLHSLFIFHSYCLSPSYSCSAYCTWYRHNVLVM